MSNKHILIACHDFAIGGHSTHTLNFGRAWRRRGWRVGAMAMEPFGDLYSDFCENLDYVAIPRRGVETRSGYIHRLVKEIAALNVGVVVNNVVPSIQAALPYLAPEVCRVSVIHNCTDYEVDLALANGAAVDWAVSVSDNILDMTKPRNVQNVRLATIPVAIEIPPMERPKTRAATPLRLIYVGRLEPQKNIPGLLRVLARLHETGVPFTMTVVGTGSEFDATRAQVAASSYAASVNFLGPRPQKEVAQLFDAHDFLVMTSHYEGTPHAMLEAIAHGVIPVVSRLPGATDRIVTDGVDGFLCPKDDPDAYVAVLRRFVEKPEALAPISAAARHTAETRYGSDKLAEAYEALFDKALSAGARPAPQPLNGAITVLPALQPHFPGLALQCKHLAADAYRQLAKGRRPVAEKPAPASVRRASP